MGSVLGAAGGLAIFKGLGAIGVTGLNPNPLSDEMATKYPLPRQSTRESAEATLQAAAGQIRQFSNPPISFPGIQTVAANPDLRTPIAVIQQERNYYNGQSTAYVQSGNRERNDRDALLAIGGSFSIAFGLVCWGLANWHLRRTRFK